MPTRPTARNAPSDPRIMRGMETQLKLRRTCLEAGETSLGWKVGFGAPAALERLELDAPLVGFLTSSTVLPSGAAVPVTTWTKPAVEPEIAVYLAQDLSGGADRDAVRAAIGALGPAIELADVSFPPDDVEAILAGNIYNRHVILGCSDPSRAGCVLDGLAGRVARNGAEIAVPEDLQSLTGDLVDIVGHIADLLALFGETLRAGELIITGSIVPPLWVSPGEEIHYDLTPIGAMSVRLDP